MKRIEFRLRLTDDPLLLMTEVKGEFIALRTDLKRDVNPQNVIERMFVNDIAHIVWEIMRYRRLKAALLNSAYRTALFELLTADLGALSEEAAAKLVERWFTDQAAQKEVASHLAKYGLDDAAIEAAAFRI